MSKIHVLKGSQVEDYFNKSIVHHRELLYNKLGRFQAATLFPNFRLLIRSIEELFNLQFGWGNVRDFSQLMTLPMTLPTPGKWHQLGPVTDMVRKRCGTGVRKRFIDLFMMSTIQRMMYEKRNLLYLLGTNINLKNLKSSINYYQSRRRYYVTLLNLIPKVAIGTERVPYTELLTNFQYYIDSCQVAMTTAYRNLLFNEALDDFEFTLKDDVGVGNFWNENLDDFYLEPQRLSLIDQLELSGDDIGDEPYIPLPTSKLISFDELRNTMIFYENAFKRYEVEKNTEYINLNSLLLDLKPFITDDYDLKLGTSDFEAIAVKYPKLDLCIETVDYLQALNSYSPFQQLNGQYYSTLFALMRFITETMNSSLNRYKRFQIKSGFVFEKRIPLLLIEHGFIDAKITRIDKKEFDVVATRGEKIYNFQCKNNVLDISRVRNDYKKIGRLNRLLCRYYEKALVKEKNREGLLTTRLKTDDIEHFVISRYPVITRNKNIINFNMLADWLTNLR